MILALGLALSLTACDSLTSVSGRVVTAEDEPIEGARVELRVGSGSPAADVTGADGHFELGALHGHARRAQLVVTKEGFPEWSLSLAASLDHPELVVVLGEGAPSPSPERGLPLSAGIPIGLVVLLVGGLFYLRSGRRRGWLALAGLGLLLALGTAIVVVLAVRSMP